MKRTALFLAVCVVLLFPWIGAERRILPNRWVRVSARLRDDREIDRIREIVQLASAHGLTGVALSAGLDTLDLKDPEYFRRLAQVRRLCEENKLEVIPSFMSAGYGGAILAHDKNLAEGLPVRDALFVVKDRRARFVPELQITIGSRSSEDPEPLRRSVSVLPTRCYRLRGRIKVENFGTSDPFGSGNFLLEVFGGDEKRPLQYENPRFSRESTEWQEVSVGFNSFGYDRVEIAPRVRPGTSGKWWIDDLRLEEVGLVNVLRRPGTPLVVKSEQAGAAYEEGRDFAAVADPGLNFRHDHDGPDIVLLPGSRISEGERLRVSYYHGTAIYNGQTPVCMSEPQLYEIWRTQVQLVHKALAPQKYLLNMDEVRTAGSCEVCRRRQMTLGEILGDCITKQFEMIRAVNPDAEVFIWSDMLDPNHNASPERKHYYLATGNFAGSWFHVPKELRIVCWRHNKRRQSLHHFSSLGFKTLAGAYYDGDDLNNVRDWLTALEETPGACGIMYTTWLNKYGLLAAFGDLVSRATD